MNRLRLPVRAVYDTNIIRAGIRSRRRPEYRCMAMIADGRVVLVAVPELFLEYEQVLKRPETLTATGLTLADIDDFLTGLAAVVSPAPVAFDWRPLLPDPDDDMVANAAINGMADCVVSSNVRDLRLLEKRFGIAVYRPQDFLTVVEHATASRGE